jgi:hypothetical protein
MADWTKRLVDALEDSSDGTIDGPEEPSNVKVNKASSSIAADESEVPSIMANASKPEKDLNDYAVQLHWSHLPDDYPTSVKKQLGFDVGGGRYAPRATRDLVLADDVYKSASQVTMWLMLLEGRETTNYPNDRGGLTKFGVSHVYHPEVRHPDFSIWDAVRIYTNSYFLKLWPDGVPSDPKLVCPLDIMTMQMGVNLGVATAKRLVQVTSIWFFDRRYRSNRERLPSFEESRSKLLELEAQYEGIALDALGLAQTGYYVSRAKRDAGVREGFNGLLNRATVYSVSRHDEIGSFELPA